MDQVIAVGRLLALYMIDTGFMPSISGSPEYFPERSVSAEPEVFG